jgi:hypothetical protein
VFLFPVAVLAPLGVLELGRHRHARILLAILLFSAPLPAVIKGAPYAIQRASGLLVAISLLAGLGLAALWATRRPAARVAAVVLAAAALWQFAAFQRDYYGNYRVRSGHAYDPTAFGLAAEAIIDDDGRSPIPRVFIPMNLHDASAKWRFYTAKHGRGELWRRTSYYAAPAELADAPAASVAVVPEPAGELAGWGRVDTVRNLMGEPTVVILRRGAGASVAK